MNILIVEDEKRLAENIGKALKLDSYNFSIAGNGIECEELLKEGHFDLVIMDRMMPKQGGLTTLSNLRSQGNNIPVIMLTALDQLEDKIEGLDSGADDYLSKPFEIDELLARVRSLLRRKDTNVKQVLSCDSLEVDTGGKKVLRSGKELRLSATEYRLLEFMISNKGQVLSETDILEHVWDRNYGGISNMVTVYVGYLRSKIDKDFPSENPIVKTMRGLGYKIDSN